MGRLGAILGRKIRESLFDMNGEKKLAIQGSGERDVTDMEMNKGREKSRI